jgi:hypothetical protein
MDKAFHTVFIQSSGRKKSFPIKACARSWFSVFCFSLSDEAGVQDLEGSGLQRSEEGLRCVCSLHQLLSNLAIVITLLITPDLV